MALIECPECKNQISDKAETCPYCGVLLSDVISQNNNQDINTISNYSPKTKSKALPIILLVVAVILIGYSIHNLTGRKYRFYKSHYQECMDGYFESSYEANSYSYGLLKNGYESIASRYQEMAADDMKQINNIRIKSVIAIIIAVVLVVISVKKQRGVT